MRPGGHSRLPRSRLSTLLTETVAWPPAPGGRLVLLPASSAGRGERVDDRRRDHGVRGAPEIAVAAVDGIYGHNSYEKSARAGRPSYGPPIAASTWFYFLAAGIDIADDRCIARHRVGALVPRSPSLAPPRRQHEGHRSFQMVDDRIRARRHAVGFADPSSRSSPRPPTAR